MASTSTESREARDRWRYLKATFRLWEALEALGLEPVKRQADGELLCRCPLPSHSGPDNHPSFILNSYTYVFTCRSCHQGGDFPGLVKAMRGISYIQGVDWACQFTDQRTPEGMEFIHRMVSILTAPREPMVKKDPPLPWIPLSALDAFNEPTDYYASRGISDEVVKQLRLGFQAEHPRGDHDFTGPAAIIPHIFKGELVGWQERWLMDDRPDWLGKYTNTTDFPKAYSLYNHDQVADNHSATVVVESALTVAKLLTAGIPAVATFGGSVTPQQLAMLGRLRGGLILAYDNDEAGEIATRIVGEATCRRVHVMVIPPPEGEKADLGDLSIEEIHYKMTEARPYILHRVSGFYK